MEQVNSKYAFDNVYNLSEHNEKNIINKISEIVKIVKPDTMVLPSPTDAHSDHKVVFEAAFACPKIFRYTSVKLILTMEIISETDFGYNSGFIPNVYVDISSTFKKKVEIAGMYKGEFKQYPFPRSLDFIKALAILRGSQAGVKYAEAFHLLKYVRL